MIVVKLGGSVITYKEGDPRFRADVATRLVRELATCPEGLVLVHGAGSFGHTRAREHAISSGLGHTGQLMQVSLIQRDMRTLNELLMEIMREEGFRPVPVAPASMAVNDAGKLVSFDTEAVGAFLKIGMTPVLFGDVVADRDTGFSILSGDDILRHIALKLGAGMTVFVTNVDGVYTGPPSQPGSELIERCDTASMERVGSWDMKIRDATGGMMRKAAVALELQDRGIPTRVINGMVEGRLGSLLLSKNVKGSYFYT